MGGWPGSVFGRTHTTSSVTNDMAHFLDVVFQLETPMLPMVRCPLPPHNFNIVSPSSFS